MGARIKNRELYFVGNAPESPLSKDDWNVPHIYVHEGRQKALDFAAKHGYKVYRIEFVRVRAERKSKGAK